ncbi:uncharacterized protein BDR25DRAFT_197797, partial [Lindgomyces ingoldianus]
KDEIRQKMEEINEREEELLIDPAFFTDLTSRLDRVSHVEILPKVMKATNELSAYRYGAVIHVCNSKDEMPPVHTVAPNAWHEFHAKMDRSSLLNLLQSSRDTQPIAISNVPYSKTIFDRHVLEALEANDDPAQRSASEFAWIATAREKSQLCPALSAVDLVELAKDVGLRVELSWARQRSNHGAIDAVFHRYKP